MSSRRSRKGGDLDADGAHPEVEVFPERLLRHLFLQVAVRGRQHARVGRQYFVAADPLDLPLLESAKKLRLKCVRQLPDFIEENGSVVGQLEGAPPLRRGAGEGAALVAEQLAFDQLGRDGPAVDDDERAVAAPGDVVQPARHQLLAAAGLPLDEDRRVGRADPADGLDQLPQTAGCRPPCRRERARAKPWSDGKRGSGRPVSRVEARRGAAAGDAGEEAGEETAEGADEAPGSTVGSSPTGTAPRATGRWIRYGPTWKTCPSSSGSCDTGFPLAYVPLRLPRSARKYRFPTR
jgi:hypothetical protein